ncbi:Signal transduction histidine-protein kinase AtoS [Sporomusa silvacetica DSM 10669]|uniref:histidine kinase n=1 Tax=Sporomusa silvacetica DSM 10669 TaxID=1123289 RepID=A0ABZ3IRK1_9FIRM|nr:ATP-binding protein [Sporomusa silvacetica]OZC20800.1 sporulation kinase E [Sporomusa silvacetica DSM 10669]
MAGVDQRGNHAGLVKRLHWDLVGRMAIGMAHEIRNPLTVIKGYLQLQEKRSTCCMGESLDIIFQELHQIEVLVTSIISLANNNAIKRKPEDLNQIIEGIYPAVRRVAVKRGIMTELRLADNLPMMDLNAEEIEQMVLNLAQNGIEAMQASGSLRIGTVCKAGRIILYVQDEGRGISPEQREEIFDPFYSTKASNAGLGLAISLSIAERHQGEIEVASTVGVGSVFKVLFPIGKQ